MPSLTLKISLFYDPAVAVQRSAVSGILRYANTYGPWHVTLNEAQMKASVPTDCSGIISCAPTAGMFQKLIRLKLPLVLFNPFNQIGQEPENMPHCVDSDTRAFGILGADFFLKHPNRSLVYAGHPQTLNWDIEREQAFAERIGERGKKVFVYPRPTETTSPTNEQIHLRDWLQTIPKPMSILAANDVRARQVLNACLLANISVPYEAVILGVDNDKWLCESTLPRLSSIAKRSEECGFEAARSLDQLIRHANDPSQPEPPRVKLLPPKEIIERDSTDFRIVPDSTVCKAISFIRLNRGLDIRASDVARHVNLSSNWLETLFRQSLGTSIIDEIARVRLDTILDLVRTTDTPFPEIAERCGFTNVSSLCRLVKKETGRTMTTLRTDSTRTPQNTG